MMLFSFTTNVSLKFLGTKIVIFMLPWSAALYLVNRFYPELIEWDKMVTNIFSNAIVFLLAYVLTLLGFRYSSSKDKDRDKT